MQEMWAAGGKRMWVDMSMAAGWCVFMCVCLHAYPFDYHYDVITGVKALAYYACLVGLRNVWLQPGCVSAFMYRACVCVRGVWEGRGLF